MLNADGFHQQTKVEYRFVSGKLKFVGLSV